MAYIGNFLLTRLAQNLDLSSTSMTVTSGDGAKFGAEMIRLYGAEMFPYYLIIRSQAYGQAVLDPNREIVQVTARDEDTFTIARGTRGTTAVAHYSGDYVQLSLQADDLIFPETTVRRLDPNLVLYLPFEENIGTMTKDLSGWSNHGTLVNGPTWTNGRVGKCLSFDGVDDYVNCGDGVSLKIGEPLTIEVWTKRQPGTPNDVKIVGNYHPDIKGYIMQSYKGNLNFSFSNGSGHINYNFGGDYRDGQWHHFVITKDSNYIRAYIDGNAQTPVNETRLIVPSDYGLGIGVGSNVWTSFPFKGLIDEVRIYNRALSASEIQDHYLNP